MPTLCVDIDGNMKLNRRKYFYIATMIICAFSPLAVAVSLLPRLFAICRGVFEYLLDSQIEICAYQ